MLLNYLSTICLSSLLICECFVWNQHTTNFIRKAPTLQSETIESQGLTNKKLDLLQKQTQLLSDIWYQIAFPGEAQIEFKLKDYGLNRREVKGMIQHFQFCKDYAGDDAFLMAGQDKEKEDLLILNYVSFPVFSEDDDFDETDGGYDSIKEVLEKEGNGEKEDLGLTVFPEEPNDDILLADTKAWVKSVIADFGVCPFTMDPDRAGIPMGGVRYTISRAQTPEEAFLAFWMEVQHLLSTTERECSTVLLVFPELSLFGNYELFEGYCDSLSDALCGSTMCFEDLLQLVFFHPLYQFRDGQARSGSEMGAANFARRSPWPMINILRTPQVRAAQKGIPTGLVYQQNEQRLAEVGSDVLKTMLFNRDWSNLPVHSSKAKALKAKLQEFEEKQAAELVAAAASQLQTEKPVAAVCPIKHDIGHVTSEAGAPSGADSLQLVMDELQQRQGEGRAEQKDYAKLAEEIERWLAQETEGTPEE